MSSFLLYSLLGGVVALGSAVAIAKTKPRLLCYRDASGTLRLKGFGLCNSETSSPFCALTVAAAAGAAAALGVRGLWRVISSVSKAEAQQITRDVATLSAPAAPLRIRTPVFVCV